MTWRALSLALALSLLLSAFSGLCFCTVHYMLTRFKVTFLGTPVDSRNGDEEKQGAHMKKSEAGASTRKQRRRAAVGELIDGVLHH